MGARKKREHLHRQRVTPGDTSISLPLQGQEVGPILLVGAGMSQQNFRVRGPIFSFQHLLTPLLQRTLPVLKPLGQTVCFTKQPNVAGALGECRRGVLLLRDKVTQEEEQGKVEMGGDLSSGLITDPRGGFGIRRKGQPLQKEIPFSQRVL